MQNAVKSDDKQCDYICSEDWAGGLLSLGILCLKNV